VLQAWAKVPRGERGPLSFDRDGIMHGYVSPEPVVAYARLLRNLHGVGAAAPVTEALVRSASFDEEVQTFMMETELARENLPALRRWMWRRKEDPALPKPPLSLRLALALAENDHETLANILAVEGKVLPVGDRVTVLRTLGRTDQARQVIAEALQAAPRRDELVALQDHARTMAEADDDRLSARAQSETLGPADLHEQEVAYDRPSPWSGGRLGVEAAHLRLVPAPGSLLLIPAESRGRLEGSASYHTRFLSAGLHLGIESAFDGPALRAGLEGALRLPGWGPGSQLQLQLSRGDSRDGVVLRTFGRRDRLAATLDLGLTRREQVRATVELRRDVTFDDAWLASGASLVLDATHHLLLGSPALRVYVQAAGAASQRAAELPATLALRLSPTATMDTILPEYYAAFSAGVSLARGELSLLALPVPMLSWGLDLSAGWLLPAQQLALRGEGALWWRFLPGHNLGGRIFLSRSQRGRAGESERGLELRYVIAWE
jgi:hypothetical protein